MTIAADILVTGEHILGEYQVTVARKRHGEWSTTVPSLLVSATNYRLILRPQTLKPYPPASIPCTYLVEARPVELGHHKGLLLRLKTRHRMYLVTGFDQEKTLRGNIRSMVRPPRDNPLFTSNVAQHDILRLIRFLEGGWPEHILHERPVLEER